MKHQNAPEIIGHVRLIDNSGNEDLYGDKVVGLEVRKEKDRPVAVLEIDIRDFKGGRNIVVALELPEVVAAISLATLNADKE